MMEIERLRAENERLHVVIAELRAEVDVLRAQAGLNAKPKHGRERIDWDAQPLGQMPDSKLGMILGVSNTSVRKARTIRGIPNYAGNTKQGRHKMIDYDTPEVAAVLGVLPDAAVARMLGIDPNTVRNARRVRGIPTPPRGPVVNQYTMHRQVNVSNGKPF